MPPAPKHPSFARRRDDSMTVMIAVKYVATCPFCLAPLGGQATTFHRHLALCDRCWKAGCRVSRRYWRRVVLLNFTRHFTSVANLSFWCPRPDWPRDLALHVGLGLTELSAPVVKAHRTHDRNQPSRTNNEPPTTR